MFIVPLTIIIFVFFVGLAVFLIIYNNKKERERTAALQQTATQLGWSFAAKAPLNMIAGLERFELFNAGHSREIKNFMYGVAQGVKAAAFDYIYVTGAGKSRQTHFQTVFYVEPANLSVPYFSLRPENFMHRILGAFGYQDIDFGQRPAFSKAYILRGADELAIRSAFNDRLLAFFENYGGTCVDGGGNQLFVFRGGYRCQPQEVEGSVGLALQIANLLREY